MTLFLDSNKEWTKLLAKLTTRTARHCSRQSHKIEHKISDILSYVDGIHYCSRADTSGNRNRCRIHFRQSEFDGTDGKCGVTSDKVIGHRNGNLGRSHYGKLVTGSRLRNKRHRSRKETSD